MQKTVTLLRIRQPAGKRMFISAFRELVAARMGAAPELFHRDASGKPKPELPHVRFCGGVGWLGVSFDPGYERLLDEHMGAIVSAVTQEWQEPAEIRVERVQTGLVFDGQPRGYWVREMVLKRRGPQARSAEIAKLAEERLLRGLIDFDRHLGIYALPEDPGRVKTLLSLEMETINPRGLRLSTTGGLTEEYVTLLDARVLACAHFKGYWWVGNLTSRGYGRMFADPGRPVIRGEDARRAFVG